VYTCIEAHVLIELCEKKEKKKEEKEEEEEEAALQDKFIFTRGSK
jgi:hypothetical protein